MDRPSTQAGARVLMDRYVLLQVMGAGGAGVVWRAHDRVLDRVVAVKLLHGEVAHDEATAARFRAEAAAAAKLTHPNAVVIYDIGRDGGDDYFVMEFVEGVTLADLLDDGPLPPTVAASLGAQVGRALGVAHARGLVHRDVKPANVLISLDGVAKVADFGIARALGEVAARLTVPGQVMGTARYLAPEQLRDQRIDPRADVYALGLVLHEALTGQPPFGTGTMAELASRRLVDPIGRVRDHRPEVSASLDEAIARATATDPDERFVDGAQFAAVLGRESAAGATLMLAERVRRARASRSQQAVASTTPITPTSATGQLGGGRGSHPPGDASSDDPDATVAFTPEPHRTDDGELRPGRRDGGRADEAHDVVDDVVVWEASVPQAAGHAKQEPVDRVGVGADGHERPVSTPTGTGASGRWAGRRSAMVALIVLVVVVGIAGAMTFLDEQDLPVQEPIEVPEPLDPAPAEADQDPVPLEIVAAGDHDPFGSGQEHPDDVPNIFDDDPGTQWQTQRYRGNPQLGGLKPGVGVWVDVGHTAALTEVRVATADPGADLTVYVGDGPPADGVEPGRWGTEVASVSGTEPEQQIAIDDGPPGRVVLLWFTSLPPAGDGEFRATVSEVAVFGT